MSSGNLNNQGQRKSNYPFQSAILKLIGGVSSALSDIATETTLNSLLTTMQNFVEFEDIIVRDTVTGTLYIQERRRNEGTGVITVTYFDVTGSVFVPVNPMEYVAGASGGSVVITGVTQDDDVALTSTNILMTGARAIDLNTFAPAYVDGDAAYLNVDMTSGELLVTDGKVYNEIQSVRQNLADVTTLDNISLTTNNIHAVGGKAVTKSTYAPSYTDGDAVMLGFDKDTGRLLSDVTGNIGGYTQIVLFSQTTQAAAYAAGDCVGGKINFSGAVRTSGGTGIMKDFMLIDKDNIKANLELIIFMGDPTLSTITDKTAFSLNAADVGKVIRRISISSSDYVTLGGVGIVDLQSLSGSIKATAGTSIYGALVLPAGSTPTYTSTNAIVGSIGILQD